MIICGDFDNGTKECCKYCGHFMLWGVNTGFCDVKNDDMCSWNSCERFKEGESKGEEYAECEVQIIQEEF